MTTRILDDSDGDANADVDAVHQVFAAVSHAWAAGDADAFVASYTEEASAILPGFALLGRAAIRDAMGDAFAGPLKGSRRVHQLRSVRFLNDADGDGAGGGGGTAIVLSRSGTALRDEAEPAQDRWSLATWVLSRHAGQWLVDSYHDCPAAPVTP
jgi:uncharacterized protein (TIGR02246 family)